MERSFWSKMWLVAVLMVLLGGWHPSAQAVEQTKYIVIYDVKDPVGDEKGPGTYVYPRGPVFDPGKGLYDLQHFRVTLDKSYAYFDATFGALNNPWGAPEGFSHQRFQVYIDEAPNKGRSETLREGAYVDFDGQHGWEYLINVVSWENTSVYHFEDDKDSSGTREGVSVRVLEDKKTIRVAVPRKHLGQVPEHWQYYVLVGAQDGLGPDNYRVVNAQPSEWYFSGGTDSVFDPNVIDLLVPPGSKPTQKQMLSSFSLEEGRLAIIKPVGPKPGEVKVSFEDPTVWDQTLMDFSKFLEKINFGHYYPVYLSGLLAIVIITLLIYINFIRRRHDD